MEYKGFIIVQANKKEIEQGESIIQIFSKDEWEYGAGCRYAEWECESIPEAKEFIDS